MCGFGVTNAGDPLFSNDKCQKRGPDLTNFETVNEIKFLHNLLHITGDMITQPFMKNDSVAVFNGEIYNYKKFGSYRSDGECILDLYNSQGDQFIKYLDGEFAICIIDFLKQKLIISNDVFGCKPLWYEIKENKFCIGSYNSQLVGLGFNQGQKLKPNVTKIFDLKSLIQIDEYQNVQFDIKQYKNSFDGWLQAFSDSIKKRTSNTKESIFVGLSSGYDSGAIACELLKQKVEFKSYSITNNENLNVLHERFKIIPDSEIFNLDMTEYKKVKNEIIEDCEDFYYSDHVADYDIKKDKAFVGLAVICKKAQKEKRKIYLSGHGADEIISDYGFRGNKFLYNSCFGGLFPKSLDKIFPWHNFWDGTQIKYLNKEELIAGHFGIETRYPFLDKDLVQEFLWLSSDLKNKKYKSCLDEYLKVNLFPYKREKIGFDPRPLST
jgi:asparagine synthetase B (glutamine-hydrolysing)